MAEVQTIEERSSEKLRGRDRRSLNLSTKLTAIEAKAIEDAASRAGKTPSEWARDVLLHGDVASAADTEMEMHIFTELVGIQMLLMNALEPLLARRQDGPGTAHRPLSPSPDNQGRARPRNSSPSAVRTRRNDMATVQQWGRKESIIWPPRGYVYTLGAFIFACILAGLFIYIRFQYGLSPLQRYYLPYYLRTETAGMTHPVEPIPIALCFGRRKAGPGSPGRRCTAGLHCLNLAASHCH